MNLVDIGQGLWGMSPAIVASFIAALMASAGIVAVALRRRWAETNRPYFAALASGVLLSTSFFLLPEAFAGSDLAPIAALAGYFVLFALGRFARRPEGRAAAAFFAISAHSLIDGVEYGLLFEASTTAGIIGAGGLILHEFAEGVILFLILRTMGIGQIGAVLLAMLGAAFTTPLGAFAASSVIPELSGAEFSMALAFAAGALLFVGASQLPEEFGELSFRSSVATYAFGAVLAAILMIATHGDHAHGDLHPHDHGGDEAEHRDHDHDHDHDDDHDHE